MRIRKLMAMLVVLNVMLLPAISCRPKPTPELTKMTTTASTEPAEEPTATSGRPTAVAEELTQEPTAAAAPVDYDVALYGNLETLDPSGQMVVYWHQHTQSREELLLSMVDEFNRTNEWDIVVFAESQGSYDNLHQRITDGIQGGRLPSMAVAYQYRAATYAVQGALIPLDPYLQSEKWGYSEKELDDFFPVVLAGDILPQFRARYGWSPYKSMEVLYYNKDWLTDLGYTGPPTTWEEFAEMACAAAGQPFSSATGEGSTYGYVYSVTPCRFATFLFSRGGDIVNERGTSYVFNSPEGLEALTFLQNLINQGCATEQAESPSDRRFGLGQSLFVIDAISRLPHYRNAVDEGAGFNWSVSPPPHTQAAPRMNTYGASQLIFVSSPAEQLAAWLFIKWMSEVEQQARWARGTGYLPIRQTTADLLTDYFTEHPAYEEAFAFMALDYGVESSVAGYDECRMAMSEMLAAVLAGEDALSQLNRTVEQCDEYLKDAAP